MSTLNKAEIGLCIVKPLNSGLKIDHCLITFDINLADKDK